MKKKVLRILIIKDNSIIWVKINQFTWFVDKGLFRPIWPLRQERLENTALVNTTVWLSLYHKFPTKQRHLVNMHAAVSAVQFCILFLWSQTILRSQEFTKSWKMMTKKKLLAQPFWFDTTQETFLMPNSNVTYAWCEYHRVDGLISGLLSVLYFAL